jgi:hypothetical protein
MGYKLAILPGMLFQEALGICDSILAEVLATGRHPPPKLDITPHQAFQRAGADEWDGYRTQFRTPAKQAAE